MNRNEETQDKILRVVWPPNFLPPVETHEPLVALSLGNKVEVFHLQNIIDAHDGDGDLVLDRNQLNEGVITITDCHNEVFIHY